MKEIKNYKNQIMAVLLLALFLGSIFPSLVDAKDLKEYFQGIFKSPKDYFQISYEPVIFSKTKISDSNIFYAQIQGKVISTRGIPYPISEARITSRVIAKPKGAGNQQLLNSAYVINIKPFPQKRGQSYEISKQIPLQFPQATHPGDYTVVGNVIKAEIKLFLFGWQDVTSYLPQSQDLGSVKYITNITSKTKIPSKTKMTSKVNGSGKVIKTKTFRILLKNFRFR